MTRARALKKPSSATTESVAGRRRERSRWVNVGTYWRHVDAESGADIVKGQRYTRPYPAEGFRAACTHSLATAGNPCAWCGEPNP